MRTFFSRPWILFFTLIVNSPLASAHTGHLASFAQGFSHPLSGVDHLLAAVAVGLWAANLRGRALVRIPLVFLTAMLAGVVFGLSGWTIPFYESGITLSLVMLGSFLLKSSATASWRDFALIGIFGLVHGNAHGVEAAELTAAAMAGLALATAGLHGLGIGIQVSLARALAQSQARWAWRGCGFALVIAAFLI